MKRLTRLSVPLLALAIAGCGEESSPRPVDGRDFDGVAYTERAPYQGRVIDGYLRNARVWLDIDGNGQYTAGPLEVVLDNGYRHVLEGGEPTALSGADGVFSLDVSVLDVPADIGPDIDHRSYPLYALAIPGQTLEQRTFGDEPVARAYLMTARPGVTNITPLTTLARFQRLLGQSAAGSVQGLASVEGVNLLQDYIETGDHRAHAYARTFARFMASQIPDAYNRYLADNGSDGGEASLLSLDGVRLLGYSLVRNAGDLVALADAAASGGDYRNVDADVLNLPDISVEVNNPRVLVRQRILASPGSGQLPTYPGNLEPSAEVQFDYNENGRLLSVTSDGCMGLSRNEIARIFEAGGYTQKLNTQWLPAVSLANTSRSFFQEGGPDEHLQFLWGEGEARFDTVTGCHQPTFGAQAQSSELGGAPEILWRWNRSNRSLTEEVSGTEGTRSLAPIRENSPADVLGTGTQEPPLGLVTGYRLMKQEALAASQVFTEPTEACTAESLVATEEDPDQLGQYVTHLFPFEFRVTDDTPVYSGMAEYEVRNPGTLLVSRPLILPVYDPASAMLESVNAGDGVFAWQMVYPPLNETDGEAHPNLIERAYLVPPAPASQCGAGPMKEPRRAYAIVEYQYQSLAEYLEGRLAD